MNLLDRVIDHLQCLVVDYPEFSDPANDCEECISSLESIKKNFLEGKAIEALSDLEHQQWALWAKYMLDYLHLNARCNDGHCIECGSPDPRDHTAECRVGQWMRQIDTAYVELSEKEKDSDREWARKAMVTIAFAAAEELTREDTKATPPREFVSAVERVVTDFNYGAPRNLMREGVEHLAKLTGAECKPFEEWWFIQYGWRHCGDSHWGYTEAITKTHPADFLIWLRAQNNKDVPEGGARASEYYVASALQISAGQARKW